jgi:hypothetical protein
MREIGLKEKVAVVVIESLDDVPAHVPTRHAAQKTDGDKTSTKG